MELPFFIAEFMVLCSAFVNKIVSLTHFFFFNLLLSSVKAFPFFYTDPAVSRKRVGKNSRGYTDRTDQKDISNPMASCSEIKNQEYKDERGMLKHLSSQVTINVC